MNARLWTAIGLTALAGCGGASSGRHAAGIAPEDELPGTPTEYGVRIGEMQSRLNLVLGRPEPTVAVAGGTSSEEPAPEAAGQPAAPANRAADTSYGQGATSMSPERPWGAASAPPPENSHRQAAGMNESHEPSLLEADAEAGARECDVAADLRDRICELAGRICDIAEENPDDALVQTQCERGTAACARARDVVSADCPDD